MKSTTQEKWEKAQPILQQIAYPRRGTSEERLDIVLAALMIQKLFTVEDLEEDR